jgi:mono/diheme cytochrome c family protein
MDVLRVARAAALTAGVATGGFAISGRAEAPPPVQTTAVIDFDKDVRPIFEQHCYECHGPKKSRGRLRLDSRASGLKGGVSGPALVAGDADRSLIVRRVLGLDGDDRMPLDKDPLPDAQIALLRTWIAQGAAWPGDAGPPPDATSTQTAAPATPEHWAYVAPRRPTPPPVKTDNWVRNPIDQFILARLEKEGLQPSHESSREALIRRVSLDLIGLPPTAAEIDAFLADPAPDAYERVVDRLLASPHYGERWARPWLDLARYADSNGYEKDALRTMWKYRDWVIKALNDDMPFDRFTIEQLAGDMLPNATTDQLIASGFHRNTLLNQEGGIDVEEARWETLVDRVNTTSTVWLGSTIACAQCHNHKYDPFSQRDYYRLLAFFDNVEYSVFGQQGGDHWIQEATLDLPTAEQETRRVALAAELKTLEARLNDPDERSMPGIRPGNSRCATPTRSGRRSRPTRCALTLRR